MKYIFFILSISLFLNSCNRTIEKMGNTANEVVLSYPSVNQFNIAASGINYWNKALLSLNMSSGSDTILLSANMRNEMSTPVTFQVGINEEAVAAYNKDTLYGPTQYKLLPADYYKIIAESYTIRPGSTDTTIKIVVYPSKIDISQTGYILPIAIKSVSGVALSSMNTVYFHIEKDPFPPYPTTGWTVNSFNSEEPAGEGAGNGRVQNIFDGNLSKFWHSKWQGGNDPLPYWFIIDMNASNLLHGFTFIDRQGVGSSGRPKDIKFETSNNLTTWKEAGSYVGADQNASWQKFAFPTPETARYFRVTISSVYGGVSYSNLAELKVY